MERRQIKKLNKITAGRISAGEVVDNPAAVLRELIDNAIDSGADKISIHVTEGGIKAISVQDNGCGIEKDQIALAFESHATSKIENIEDLYTLHTMGFRGEALYSIATVSRLSISSDGVCVTNDNGKLLKPTISSINEGTLVTVEGLFDIIPARKQFLKRASSEGMLCKKVFLEKALGFERIDFLYYEDSELSLYLPKGDKLSRALQIMGLDKAFNKESYYQMSLDSDTVKLSAVSSSSSYYKRDRTQIKIFMNNRVIDCFPLVQVITNSFSESLPGGAFPFFYLFIENDPALVDFNIHPAKRECKIRNQNQISGLLSQMIRDYLLSEGRKNMEKIRSQMTVNANKNVSQMELDLNSKDFNVFNGSSNFKCSNTLNGYNGSGDELSGFLNVSETSKSKFDYAKKYSSKGSSHSSFPASLNADTFKPKNDDWFEKAKELLKPNVVKPNVGAGISSSKNDLNADTLDAVISSGAVNNKELNYRYLGQVFDTFLVVEISDSVLFVDQHAAHERILYEELTSTKEVQNLLVPHRFETDLSTDEFLSVSSAVYQEFGIMLARVEPMVWELLSVPSACKSEEENIVKYIKSATGDLEVIKKGIFAILACHSAIKAGEKLDDYTAKNLLDKVFNLDAMVCPHGRNFTYSISKLQLYSYVGRTI